MSGKPFEGLGPGAKGLAWAYSLGQRVHAGVRLQNVERAGVPVISIGNLLVGGTGKTPVATAIAQHFSASRKTAVVSRGYGGRAEGVLQVSAATDPAQAGDEPVEIAVAAPQADVWVSRDRMAGAKAAVQAGAELVLLDDGFGYRGLHRDVDLVIFDERGIGNGLLLPAGPLREPVHALARADAILLRGTAEAPAGWLGPVFRFQVMADGFADWDGNAVAEPVSAVAAAGIGWPDRFFDGLRSKGIELAATFPLTDHAAWPASLVRKISLSAGGRPIIITQKDAVKLRRHRPPGTWIVARQRVEFEAAFWPWIEEHATLV